jgi:cytidylate kinase
MSDRIVLITIDGPSGSGKGTVARAVATALGLHFLDSGALYRAVGLRALRMGVALDDDAGLDACARGADVRFIERGADEPQVWLDGEEVSALLRSEACAAAASQSAARPPVRAALLAKQRELAQAPGLVADGRDMGTIVFPEAQLKVFLDASVEERARRRHKQLMDKGIRASLDDLSRDLAERDLRDRSRAIAPLKPAADAVIVDSTAMDASSVVDFILQQVRSRGLV